MEQIFSCPNCGASLEYTGNEPSMLCTYCHNTVPIPETLLQANLELQATKTAQKAGKYLVIFIIIIVALTIISIFVPACLGGIATVVGIVLGIAGPLFALIIQIFTQH